MDEQTIAQIARQYGEVTATRLRGRGYVHVEAHGDSGRGRKAERGGWLGGGTGYAERHYWRAKEDAVKKTVLPQKIVFETTGVARGKVILEQRLTRVRWGDEAWRDSKSDDFNKGVTWMMNNGYVLSQFVPPSYMEGTCVARYIYVREEGA